MLFRFIDTIFTVNSVSFLVQYRELGPLFHDLVSQHCWGDRPLLPVSLLAPCQIQHRARAAGVFNTGLKSAIHSGLCDRALERWWCLTAGASVHATGLASGYSKSASMVVPGYGGGRLCAVRDTA